MIRRLSIFALTLACLFVTTSQASAQYVSWAYLANKPMQPAPTVANGLIAFQQGQGVISTIQIYNGGVPDNTLTMNTIWYFPTTTTPIQGMPAGNGVYQATHNNLAGAGTLPTLLLVVINMTAPNGFVVHSRYIYFMRI